MMLKKVAPENNMIPSHARSANPKTIPNISIKYPIFVPIFIAGLSLIHISLPALALGAIAQILLKIWTSRYHAIVPVSGLNGAETVEKIVKAEGFPICLLYTSGITPTKSCNLNCRPSPNLREIVISFFEKHRATSC